MKILVVLLFCFSTVSATNWVEPYIQAELAIQNKEFDKGLELYQTSISNDNSQAASYLGITQVYLEKGDYIKAKEALDKAKNAKHGFDRENVQKYRLLMMALSARKGDMESYKYFHNEYLSNSNEIPRTFRENGSIYITNAPKSEETRLIMEAVMKECDGVVEVQWKGDIGIAKIPN